MDAFLSSFSLVAIAEIGDKTQLLSILLAARFRCFFPLMWGILLATILNHAGAAWVGKLLASATSSMWVEIVVGALFVAIGAWLLIPDDEPEDEANKGTGGAFITSLITFFIAEMGDKTQFATITLGAQYASTWMVIFGTTFGMMAANIPALLLGETILQRIPLKAMRITASTLFILYGIYSLVRIYLQSHAL